MEITDFNPEYRSMPAAGRATEQEAVTEPGRAMPLPNTAQIPLGELPTAVADPKALLADLLKTYGLKAMPENIRMLEVLVDNQFPLDKETVASFNQALKLMGSEHMDKAIFFLENGMRATAKNAVLLDQLIKGDLKITGQLSNLMESLESIANPVLKEKIANIFLRDSVPMGGAVVQEKTVQASTGTVLKPETLLQDGEHKQLPSPEIQKMDTKEPLTGANEPIINGKVTLMGEPLSAGVKHGEASLPTPRNNALSFLMPEELQKMREQIQGVLKDGNITPDVLKDGSLSLEKLLSIAKDIVKSGPFSNASPQVQLKLVKELAEYLLPDAGAQDPIAGSLPPEKAMRQRLAAKLSFPLEKSGNRDVDAFLHSLRDNLNEARRVLMEAGADKADIAKMIKDVDNIREHIEFVTHLKNDLYIQLPLNLYDNRNNSELFIFRDGKKGKKSATGTASALIALDTKSLGRFEAYVQKSETKVNCQFRLENLQVERLVRDNLGKLETLLGEYGYTLAGFSFKQLSEAFTLLDSEPAEIGEAASTGEHKQFALDMKM